jgi:arsenate reductase (thioredoxin)
VNVLFVCIGNQGRSVMAERIFRASGSSHVARSAGAEPGDHVHPVVLDALRELEIDASDHVPRRLDDELLTWADVVVATCDDSCPVTPGATRFDWHLPDPMNRPLAEVRVIRDEIARRVAELVESLPDVGNAARRA